ncbi:apolipoprotein N-acyltransferase [Chelativorans sp. Marseille-P2723]|uniref:apolipoprotein N-acyltransferase n=1 Tax=Chelativorans sp. Marseille-P2723 TaxID=2709133 RepID=UPI0015713D4C|nr:apolipoprotein N-acyltransferase [Chelativorans sp. Marseille-P2723]
MEDLAGRFILLWGWPRRGAAFLAGAGASLALPPLDFPAAFFLAFPVLVWLLDGQPDTGGPFARFLPAFSAGWWFGFGYFLASAWWIGIPFRITTESIWAVLLATVAVPALLALFYGAATLVARSLWSDGVGRIAALAFGFGLAEWLRSFVPIGSAWNVVGYAAMPVPVLMQLTELIGIAGVSALAVFVSSVPALLGTRTQVTAGFALACILVAIQAGYGYYRLAGTPAPSDVVNVRIVQPASGAQADFDELFRAYLDLSTAPPSENGRPTALLIWPELAIPFVLADRPDLLSTLAALAGSQRTLITGALRKDDEGHFYNSVVAITGKGIIDASDKVRLPPAIDGSFLNFGTSQDSALPPGKGFRPGAARRPLSLAEGMTLLPLIGTEVASPGIAESVHQSVDIIVNPALQPATAAGAKQHLRQAQLRALEAGLPIVVAFPDGFSAAIDARGRILAGLANNVRGYLDVSLPLTKSNVLWNRSIVPAGLVFCGVFGLFALLIMVRSRICVRRN